ncbi:hypothetical protein LTR09_012116 [Extremus antarcticus]|uniref:Uncharacterized protein n=1 Tax=Extremus antarcticus TaxID=702011 RepID=A0AAJ0G725_9PEZI|nr:hypothetical protein LTR09_012116 [Extremus antarcticus]
MYNNVHQWMVESPSQAAQDAWITLLDQLEAYDAAIVVGSHQVPGGVDGSFNLEATRDYVRTFRALVNESSSAEELYDKVRAAYPDRQGLTAPWLGCTAQFQAAT